MIKKTLTLILVLSLILMPMQGMGEVMLRLGGAYDLAVDDQGNIWGWGDNTRAQLGNGGGGKVFFPEKAAVGLDGNDILDIQCGNVGTLFLLKDGSVFVCGSNEYGQTGLNNGKGKETLPVRIPGLENIVQVSCGWGHCLALTGDGHVYSWGRNNMGQLGVGDRKNRPEPVLLSLEHIVQIECGGKFCMAMDAEGKLFGWGANDYGQLAGASKSKWVGEPVELPLNNKFSSVCCGGGSVYGLCPDGSILSWGQNDYLQLGRKTRGAFTPEAGEVELPEGVQFKTLQAYNGHVSLLDTQGRLFVWGCLAHGQANTGKRPSKSLPVEATPDAPVLMAAVGSVQSAAVLENGRVVTIGGSEYGQSGAFSKGIYYVTNWADTELDLLSQ